MGLNFDPAASERIFRRMDRIVRIDQNIMALRTERARLVRENEADEWRAQGHRWRGRVVRLSEYRNNLRFRLRHQPTTNCA